MTLPRGKRLGHYEIAGLLGAGGMGEVYRARDIQLGREVALKVLPADVSRDPERIRRFEREGKAIAAISHPNILAIHDFGVQDGTAYAVMELLEGKTLREALAEGMLSARKAGEIGAAIAQGLAAAHAKGIVHRDLKPENVFVTRDGHVKILDFGLATALPPAQEAGGSHAPTVILMTAPGTVVGTVGYMSPEQVRGGPVDARSDIFSLGILLYEMLFERRPFQGNTAADTASAILTQDPVDLTHPPPNVPVALARVVGRCLKKTPPDRFQSAFDVGLALEVAGDSAEQRPTDTAGRERLHQWRWPLLTIIALVLVAVPTVLVRWSRSPARPAVPAFERITFRRGYVGSARFAPDGQTVVYSAAWGGNPAEVYVQRLGTPDARSLGVGQAVLGLVGNEVGILHGNPPTVARVPLEGGAPRDVLDNVVATDWSREGSSSLVVRQMEGHQELEYPVGNVLHRTTGMGMIRSPRLSPQGDRIAFIDNTGGNVTYNGDVVVLDLSGRGRVLSKGWDDVGGLAWSPDGREVWFTATRGGMTRALHAVTLEGKERLVSRVAGSLVLQDIAPDGRALLTHGQRRSEMRGRMAGDTAERDLSWLDGTLIPRLSVDGTQMVFEECEEGGGFLASSYLRRTDGTSPVRLGTGEPMDVSSDWTRVVARSGFRYPDNGLQLVPIGAGETQLLPRGTIRDYMWVYWHPDGRRLLIVGNEESQPSRLFVQELPDGLPQPLVPEPGTDAGGKPISPDGTFFLARQDRDHPWMLYSLNGGEAQSVRGLLADDTPCGWTADSRFLFVTVGKIFPVQVMRFDLKTGRREPWLELCPPDRAGIASLYGSEVTADGLCYAYCYVRTLSDLYVVGGLK